MSSKVILAALKNIELETTTLDLRKACQYVGVSCPFAVFITFNNTEEFHE